MSKKEFKAESKRLLELMIHSIYTNKEIFLRELISNASDAMDKLYYKALTENISNISKSDLSINLSIDKENRVLVLSDSGIGMTKEELETHLGTIANSGSHAFKNENEHDEIDIIGQFGVGFYSAFMVADKVEVITKKYGEDQGHIWVCDAIDGYEIFESNVSNFGTTIKLYIKENLDEESYDNYLNEHSIEQLIKKYSDYVHYPIKMDITTSKKIDDSDEYEDVVENKILNSMIPLWKKPKKDITNDDYNEFYKDKFNDYSDPLKVVHTSVEGAVSYDALLYIPSVAPMNYYSEDYEKGLQLYSSGVFIMDKASDLVPDHFRFVKGLVDSQDLNLNISRELLQQDKQLKFIGDKIEKKIQSELENMLKKDRENYELFFKNFGQQLKFGIYHSYGMLKDKLADLLLYYSATKKSYITLQEYIDNMKEEQTEIYFASGESYDKIDGLPQVELVLEKGFDIIYMTDHIDQFTIQMMNNYKEKSFKNVAQGDLDINTNEEKEELEKQTNDNKELLDSMKVALGDKVVEVKISSRLKSHPVCLVSSDGLSLEMEKVLSAMPNDNDVKANRILEINPNHEIFEAIQSAYKNHPDRISDYSMILYDQASLIEGLSIDNAVEFANRVCKLMIDAN